MEIENYNLTGQLWEPCVCGEEPVYQSVGNICKTCVQKMVILNAKITEMNKNKPVSKQPKLKNPDKTNSECPECPEWLKPRGLKNPGELDFDF